MEDRAFPHAEISDDGVRGSDTDAGEVFRCWVQNGVFVLAGVGMVEVVPADLAEHRAVSRFLVWWDGDSVHNYGLVCRVDVVPGTWLLPGSVMVVRVDWGRRLR